MEFPLEQSSWIPVQDRRWKRKEAFWQSIWTEHLWCVWAAQKCFQIQGCGGNYLNKIYVCTISVTRSIPSLLHRIKLKVQTSVLVSQARLRRTCAVSEPDTLSLNSSPGRSSMFPELWPLWPCRCQQEHVSQVLRCTLVVPKFVSVRAQIPIRQISLRLHVYMSVCACSSFLAIFYYYFY